MADEFKVKFELLIFQTLNSDFQNTSIQACPIIKYYYEFESPDSEFATRNYDLSQF